MQLECVKKELKRISYAFPTVLGLLWHLKNQFCINFINIWRFTVYGQNFIEVQGLICKYQGSDVRFFE
jgi:hypothetical protein